MRDVPNGTLTELLDTLDDDALRRGKQFEKIVKWWLQNDPARNRNIKAVWLWDEWADRPGRDIGIDLVAELLDGSLCAIQVKCYDAKRDIPKSEIDSFISAASPRTFAQRWLVATTNGLSANARQTIHDNHVTFVPLAELDATAVTWPSHPDALKAVKKPGKAKPRPHQQRAIRDVLRGLEANSRGQLIMACGTGKTLTALWITERLDTNTTLVLVPSLNLLSQTLTEWAHNTRRDWTYICVCSDDTVNKEDDQPINTTVDLPYPVTTKPSEIAHFLKRKGRKIVFSTYQSSAQVAKAQKLSGKKFDLAICDEAHRLTGKTKADYATVLDEKKIISKKRLFMTATPRTYTTNVKAKAKERGVEITSMDDPNIYGPQFHRLTFGEAIKQKLLTDYQVVIVGVTDPQVQDLIDRRELVSVNDTVTTDARTLAAHIGLAKATKDFNLARTISFHSRIKTAAQFAEDHPKILDWLPESHKPQGTTWTDTISGDMNTGQRRTLLQQLRKDQPGRHALLTNARCLTEGIDVPALDGVGFVDPRSSRVDIIQAVGRAIRKSQNKKLGTIVLPVLLPTGTNQHELLDSSSFKPIWEILNALKSHDSELGEELDQLRTELGRTTRIGGNPPKIRLDLPRDIELTYPHFREHLILAIVERTTTSWDWWFGLAQAFAKEFRSISIIGERRYKGHDLGGWAEKQRADSHSGTLDKVRATRLLSLPGWSWDPLEDQWNSNYEELKSFAKKHGHATVPDAHQQNGIRLGKWIGKQRIAYKRGRLAKDKVTKLQDVKGWSWSGRNSSRTKSVPKGRRNQ
jgi:predicted helicase